MSVLAVFVGGGPKDGGEEQLHAALAELHVAAQYTEQLLDDPVVDYATRRRRTHVYRLANTDDLMRTQGRVLYRYDGSKP